MKRELVAQVAHEVNRAYCASLGDESVPAWAEASKEHQASILAGVDMHMANPDATPEQSHESWLAAKAEDGWTHGEVKDAKAKTHPCMLPYAELPAEQRAKDHIFRGVVHALKAISDSTVIAIDASTMSIKYIGKRATHVDAMYGTRIFWSQPGESHLVPKDKALLMLNHRDVYAMGDPVMEPAARFDLNKPAEDDQAEKVQEVLDSIAFMSKDALQAFAKTNFRADLDKRQSIAALRTSVADMVHRFGVA